MAEHRMEPRTQVYAKVIIESRPGYLRNLTDEGCKIVTMNILPSSIGEMLTFQIIPEETSGIGRITAAARLRWKKKDGPYFVNGMQIHHFATAEDKERFTSLVALYGRS
jgi:hypothetical protein